MTLRAIACAIAIAASIVSLPTVATAQTPQSAYVEPLTADNAVFLFIDNQTNLLLGVQSMDTTLLRNNTEGLAQLAKIFAIPVVLTTTGGGAAGPAGGLISGITQAFPKEPIIDRQEYFNAMSDPKFAGAVKRIGRKKIVLSGLTTDYCLVYPAATLIAQGYHVYIVTDASGSFTAENQISAMQRLIQMGATPVNMQSLVGELQNSAAVANLVASKRTQPQMIEWFSRYSAAPSILNMNMAQRAGLPK